MSTAWNPARRRVGRVWGWAIGLAVLAGLAIAGWYAFAQQQPRSRHPEQAASKVDPVAVVPQKDPAVPEVAATGMSVAGVVVAPDGRPAPGATVRIYRARSAWPEWRTEPLDQEAITGADGRFQFRVTQRLGVLIGFEHPSFAGGLEEVARNAGSMRLQLQPGFELFGEIRNSAGAPVANARVALESVLSEQRRARAVTTGANGSYRFANLPAGPVRIVVRHPSWLPVAVPVHVIGDVLRRDFAFDRPAMPPVRGRVISAATQAPVEGALIELLASNGRPGFADPIVARTAADGTFALVGMPRGNMRIFVRHPDHGALLRNVTIGASRTELAYELPQRSSVNGRLAGAAGGSKLVGGEVLEIRDSAGQVELATIADDLTFRFPASLTPGSATILVPSGAFAFERTQSREVAVRVEDGPLTEVELPIVPPTVVRGRLVDTAGRPLPAASVSQTKVLAESARSIGTALTNFEFGTAGSRVFQLFGGDRDEHLALSRADGGFEIRGQKPGLLSVRIELAGRGSRWLSVVVPSGAEPLDLGDIVLAEGCRVQGRVLRNKRGLGGAAVTAVGQESQAVTMTRRDGTFVFEDLQPGEYSVRARLASMPTSSPEQRVVASRERPAREPLFELDAGRVVRGEVSGTDGQPVLGAVVTVRGVVGQTTLTDQAGDFLLELPARAIDLQVSLGDRSRQTIVPVSATAESVRIRLDTPPVTTIGAIVAGLPSRKRMTSALLRFTRLDDPADTATRATWLELQNGELAWASCPVGRVRIEVWCEGFAPHVVEREFLASGVQNLGEILLEPGGRLAGVVREAGGAPVGNAMVWLGEETDVDLFEPRVRTAADGSFRLAGVTSRSSRLVVRASGFAPRTVDLELPQDVLAATPLEVVLERGAVVEVLFAGTEKAAAGRVELRQSGRLVASAELDETGRAWFPNRSAGTYEVSLLGSDGIAKSVVVDGDEPVRVLLP